MGQRSREKMTQKTKDQRISGSIRDKVIVEQRRIAEARRRFELFFAQFGAR